MNQPDSGAAPVESFPSPMPFKDRTVGLVVFGILTILLGGMAALFVLVMLAQVVFARAITATPSFSVMLPGISIYGFMAVALVWLGIGSIKARRWARALLLIFSWSWLIVGVLTSFFMAFLMPRIPAHIPAGGTTGQPAMPPVAQSIAMAVMFLFLGVFFVILPSVWTVFYCSRHVKATCETRDPETRWTDACPLPVLGLSVLLMVSAPMMLLMPMSGHCVLPFFGVFLTGIPGAVFCLIFAAVWAYAAWLLYKLEQRGWWLVLIVFFVNLVSGLLTFARHDMMDMYRLMDYPEAQLEQIQKSGMVIGNHMAWIMLFSMLPVLGYLLFIRKFFRRAGS